jgi:hypothetical protein
MARQQWGDKRDMDSGFFIITGLWILALFIFSIKKNPIRKDPDMPPKPPKSKRRYREAPLEEDRKK